MNEVVAKHPPLDLRWSEKAPALLLLAALLFVGFWPKSLSVPINSALPAPAKVAAAPSLSR
jgi:NADH-quinone oxidoreductase subunit M